MIVHPSRLGASQGIRLPAAIPATSGIGRTWMWTDTSQVEGQSAGRAWHVNFNNGNCNHNDIGNNNYVRAVRSGKSSCTACPDSVGVWFPAGVEGLSHVSR